MNKWILALALTTAFLSPTTYASTVYGSGGNSCGEWVEARKNDTYYQMADWILGFLSGAQTWLEILTDKAESPIQVKEINAASMAVWTDNFCQANPLESIHIAAFNLSMELIAKQGPPND